LVVLKRILRKVHYAILLLKLAGPRVFARELRHQVCSRTTFIGLEKDLDAEGVPVQSRIEYTLRPASEEDMKEVLQRAKSEDKESARELLLRKWFYDAGFHNCYIARTADANELCYMQWLVSPDDNNKVSRQFSSRFPRLKEHEIRLENAFTLDKYRGNRVMSSVMVKLSELARSRGFKRLVTFVGQNNIASLKGCGRAGFKKFEEISELKLFFFTKRKTVLRIKAKVPLDDTASLTTEGASCPCPPNPKSRGGHHRELWL
jgi:hypothetical protein